MRAIIITILVAVCSLANADTNETTKLRIDSFCGIRFGSTMKPPKGLVGLDATIDVKLDRPFRLFKDAHVIVGGENGKVMRVEIFAQHSGLKREDVKTEFQKSIDIVNKKYGINLSESCPLFQNDDYVICIGSHNCDPLTIEVCDKNVMRENNRMREARRKRIDIPAGKDAEVL